MECSTCRRPTNTRTIVKNYIQEHITYFNIQFSEYVFYTQGAKVTRPFHPGRRYFNHIISHLILNSQRNSQKFQSQLKSEIKWQ